MNEYLKLAGRYFDTFEGRQLYPSLKTWHWWGWCASLLALGACLRHGVTQGAIAPGNLPTITVYLAEAVFLAVSLAIDSYKKQAVLAAAKTRYGKSFDTIDDCRRDALQRICGVPSERFAAVAKECADLMALQRTHGLAPDSGAQYYWRKIYDRESKARLLAIVLASLGIFVALMTRALPEGYPSILEIIGDSGLQSFVGIIMFVSAMLFGIWLGAHAAARLALKTLGFWLTKLTGRSSTSRVALRYFLGDLVRFHVPSLTAGPRSASEPPQRPRPSASRSRRAANRGYEHRDVLSQMRRTRSCSKCSPPPPITDTDTDTDTVRTEE